MNETSEYDVFRTVSILVLTFAVLVGITRPAQAVTVTPKDDFWALDGGSMGTRGLQYPVLLGADQQPIHKRLDKQIDGTKAAFKYEGGATIESAVEEDGTITLDFSAVPADARFFKLTMRIPASFIEGGSWKFDNAAEQPFPREKPENSAQLHQGNARTFTLKHREGRALEITLPSEFCFNQLQDNREWGEKVFVWFAVVPFYPEVTRYKVKIAEIKAAAGAAAPKPLVDEFGQNALMDFPGKVKSLDELKSDVESEKAYYASLSPPQRDAFGGLLGSDEKLGLKKTGFFHVEQHGERWILVNPEGNAFFHLGVSSFMPQSDFTYVEGRKHIYAWLPTPESEYAGAYMAGSNNTNFSFHQTNLIRKYGHAFDVGQFQSLMIDRVRKWGFNAIGAFTAIDAGAVSKANFPFMRELPLNAYSGMPIIPGVRETFDPFDDASRERAMRAMERSVAPLANNPLLIGYYVSNEPGLEELPRVVPGLRAKFACKRRLVEMLQQKYATIDAFNTAWSASANNFDELPDTPLAVQTKQAADDVQAFTGIFLDAYFSFVRDAVRKYDPNHMLIGNRLQSGAINNEQLCRISGKYLDAISFNYYTYRLDKDFLKRIHAWSGRPMFLSEFYWGAPSESGLPGGVKDVATQEERGLAYRNYVEQAASLGFVVGTEWYTLMDMAQSGLYYGKYIGDNGNCGLISASDRPWKTMLGHMAKTNYDIYAVQLGERPPFVFDNPRYNSSAVAMKTVKIYRTPGAMKIDGRAEGWPGIPAETIAPDRVVEGAGKDVGIQAHFKLCWDEQNLYVLANVTDPTPMLNKLSGDMLWAADGLELFVGHEKLDAAGPLLFSDRQVLLSAGKEPRSFFVNQPKQAQCQIAVIPEVDGSGYTLEAAIPFASLGFSPTEGQSLRFDLAIDNSNDGSRRAQQLMWNGSARNAGDRTDWGKAVFVR